jgi:DNA-binding transcriptional ArsR family regulator
MFLLKSTKLRRKLLTYLFGQPGRSHYVRELAAHITEDPGNLSRELRHLEEEGVVRSERRGSLKFYSLDKDYPFHKELEKIVSKTEGIEDSLKKMIAEFPDITVAFVCGPYAKDEEKKTSDIDMVVVGTIDEGRWAGSVRALENSFNKRIHSRIYPEQEFSREKSRPGSFLNLMLKDKVILL